MTKQKRIINLEFISVKTIKRVEGGAYMRGLFYNKSCLFCRNEFEAQRQEAAFCSQRCQKAYTRKQRIIKSTSE